jgi:hypothetical protein
MDSGAMTHDPSVAVRRRHLPSEAGEGFELFYAGWAYLLAVIAAHKACGPALA